MTTLFFDCFSGAAGDMLLGALLDAGVPETEIRRALDGLDLEDWDLEVRAVSKRGIRATQAIVHTGGGGPARAYRDIRALLEEASLDDGVRARALRTFELLAEAEARVHSTAIDEVHFHELGGVDAIVDVVGVSAALEHLGPSRIVTSALPVGRGVTSSMHGTIPVPAPAVTEMLAARGAEIYEGGHGELATPTGAAILCANADEFGALPHLELRAAGWGAGARDVDPPAPPNLLRVLVGDAADRPTQEHALMLETNLDDMAPELVPHVIARLLDAGAQDAWITPITMKKGRPALKLSALAAPADAGAIEEIFFTETTTLGLRITPVTKTVLEREWVTVEVEGHEVRVKLGRRGGVVTTAAPEHDDALEAARATGLPLKEVYRRALDHAHAGGREPQD